MSPTSGSYLTIRRPEPGHRSIPRPASMIIFGANTSSAEPRKPPSSTAARPSPLQMKSQDERTGEVNVDFTSQIVIAPSWSEAVGVPNPDMVADDARPRRADPDPLQPGAALHGSAPDEADGEATSGLLLDGRYRLIELLGRGGSGAVYRGTDLL